MKKKKFRLLLTTHPLLIHVTMSMVTEECILSSKDTVIK